MASIHGMTLGQPTVYWFQDEERRAALGGHLERLVQAAERLGADTLVWEGCAQLLGDGQPQGQDGFGFAQLFAASLASYITDKKLSLTLGCYGDPVSVGRAHQLIQALRPLGKPCRLHVELQGGQDGSRALMPGLLDAPEIASVAVPLDVLLSGQGDARILH